MVLYSPRVLRLLSHVHRVRNWYRGGRKDIRRSEEHRSAFYAAVWRDGAARFGASVSPLSGDLLEIRCGQAYTRVRQNTTVLDDPLTIFVAANKPLVYRLLAARGLSVPDYFGFTLNNISQAAAFIDKFGGEWVVKPANGSGGRGVTTGVTGTLKLVRAAVAAAAYDSALVVERQIEGDLYRLLYLDGTLLDAVLRKPASVVGDGKSTIRDLVTRENQKRLEAGPAFAQGLLSVDLDMRRTVSKQHLSLSSVPEKGARVTVKKVINENSAADNVPAANLLCNSIIEDGAAAAAALGVRFAGVDIITKQPDMPLAQSGGVILEVNTTPSFHSHYYRQGEPFPVALHALSCILSELRGDRAFLDKGPVSSITFR
jgi:D-alanine-D-alanine ligase-like ATP-grasp enzyme